MTKQINVERVREYYEAHKNDGSIITSAEIIEASKCIETGAEIFTFDLYFQRFLLSEQNTHRDKSRNTGSGRAIPIMKMLRSIIAARVKPMFYGANKSGMQSTEDLPAWKAWLCSVLWFIHAVISCLIVFGLHKLGLHKQWANRLIEPHLYIRQVMTGTDWDNYLTLRLHDDAQPEIILLALMIQEKIEDYRKNKKFRKISYRLSRTEKGWHLPYVTEQEREKYKNLPIYLAKLSAARCARTSYFTQDNLVPSEDGDLRTFRKLAESKPIHASPLEHQAHASKNAYDRSRNFVGWVQYREIFEETEFGAPIRKPTVF